MSRHVLLLSILVLLPGCDFGGFCSAPDHRVEELELWSLDLDSSERRLVVDAFPTGEDGVDRFDYDLVGIDPAENEVYFLRHDSLQVLKIDSSAPKTLNIEPPVDKATLSPDGRWIAYTRGSWSDELWLARTNGSERRRIGENIRYTDGGNHFSELTWLQDSQHLAYHQRADSAENSGVRLGSVSGGEPQVLSDIGSVASLDVTNDASAVAYVGGIQQDGRRYAYVEEVGSGQRQEIDEGSTVRFVNGGKGILYTTDLSNTAKVVSRNDMGSNLVTTLGEDSPNSIGEFRVSPSDEKTVLPVGFTANLYNATVASPTDLFETEDFESAESPWDSVLAGYNLPIFAGETSRIYFLVDKTKIDDPCVE